MPSPNGRELMFDPSAAGGLLGWWSGRAAGGFLNTGPSRAVDLSGNGRDMAAISPGAAVGWLGWAPDGAIGGMPSFSQDLASATTDGLTASIPSMSAPYSFYLVSYGALGTGTADLFGLNSNGTGVGGQTRLFLSSGTSWSMRFASSGNSVTVTGIALGIAHVAYVAQDISGNTCSIYIDDPYTARASIAASATISGMTNAILLNNASSNTNKGCRFADGLLYQGAPHDTGTRLRTFRWLASRNKLKLSRIFD